MCHHYVAGCPDGVFGEKPGLISRDRIHPTQGGAALISINLAKVY